jgi:hypothetical protein
MDTILFVGMKITPLVVFWSTMTIIESKPSLSGKSVRVVGGDRRPHADMSSKRLYSAFSRYMSDPQLHVTRCLISVSPGNPQGQQDHTMYL